MFSHLILCLVGRAEAGELKAAAGWVLIQHWYYFTVKESLSVLSLWTVEERNVSMNSTVWFIKNGLFGIVGRVHRHPTAPLFDEVGMILKYQLFSQIAPLMLDSPEKRCWCLQSSAQQTEIRVSRIQLCVHAEWPVRWSTVSLQWWTWTLTHKVKSCFYCKLTRWRWCTEGKDSMVAEGFTLMMQHWILLLIKMDLCRVS